MKKILILILINLFFSCNNKSNKEDLNSLKSKKENIQIVYNNDYDKNLLNGVWAENEDDNALFFIKNDSINYFDVQNSIYPVSLKLDTLIIPFKDYVFKGKVLALTNDSLIYIADSRIIKLYNRKE